MPPREVMLKRLTAYVQQQTKMWRRYSHSYQLAVLDDRDNAALRVHAARTSTCTLRWSWFEMFLLDYPEVLDDGHLEGLVLMTGIRLLEQAEINYGPHEDELKEFEARYKATLDASDYEGLDASYVVPLYGDSIASLDRQTEASLYIDNDKPVIHTVEIIERSEIPDIDSVAPHDPGHIHPRTPAAMRQIVIDRATIRPVGSEEA